jgi:hypothetical protein
MTNLRLEGPVPEMDRAFPDAHFYRLVYAVSISSGTISRWATWRIVSTTTCSPRVRWPSSESEKQVANFKVELLALPGFAMSLGAFGQSGDGCCEARVPSVRLLLRTMFGPPIECSLHLLFSLVRDHQVANH